jgi:ribosomal protein L11 methylase PrmA
VLDYGRGSGILALAAQPFDVIVADILARPLIELAPRLVAGARR